MRRLCCWAFHYSVFIWLLSTFVVVASDEQVALDESPRQVFIIRPAAPNPDRLKEYEGYKASVAKTGATESQQRALDEFAANCVFRLHLPKDILGPDSDGVELRRVIDRAEQLHAHKSRTHDVVGNEKTGYAYVPKPETIIKEQADLNMRLLASALRKADREWVSDATRSRLFELAATGESGRKEIEVFKSEMDARRIAVGKLRQAERIGDEKRTQQINRGQAPTYKHPYEDSLREMVDSWSRNPL